MNIELRYDDTAARAALRKSRSVVERMLGAALARGAETLRSDAYDRAAKKDATSQLSKSIAIKKHGDLHYSVAPGEKYGVFVEGGRMPMRKMPGIGLRDWIKQKLKPATDKELDRLDFVISRAIQRQGIQPAPYMQPAYEAKKGRVIELANEAMRKAVAEINGGSYGAA